MRVSNQIIPPTAFATSNATLFTLAAYSAATAGVAANATQAEITHIHIFNSGSAGTISLFIGSGGSPPINCLYSAYSIPAGGSFDDYGPYIILAGGTLQGFASAATLIITVVADLILPG